MGQFDFQLEHFVHANEWFCTIHVTILYKLFLNNLFVLLHYDHRDEEGPLEF